MHNAGAYGFRTTESGFGVKCTAAGAAESLASSRSLPAGSVARVRMILMSGRVSQRRLPESCRHAWDEAGSGAFAFGVNGA